MRHPGGKRAQTGETIAAANLQLEPLERRDVGQYHQRAEDLSIFAAKDRRAGANDDASIIEAQDKLVIFLALIGSQCVAQCVSKRFRKFIDGVIENVPRIQFCDLPGLVVENSNAFVNPRSDHARSKVFEQCFVVDLCVLHFGKQLRVFDGDGQLTAENLERVLLHAAINPSGKA